MLYDEQLILTGALDDVGTPIRTNSGQSYRFGFELDSGYKFSSFLLNANMTLSSNKNKEIISLVDGALFNHGKTNISFSPSIIGSSSIVFNPTEKTSISFYQNM